MAKKSERSLMLFCVLFIFGCLLLSGGWRLVGSRAQEESMQVRPFATIRAVLSGAIASRTETGMAVRRDQSAQRMQPVPAPQESILIHRVLSDANGNVLAGKTYMRAVYQAFVLGDGFV